MMEVAANVNVHTDRAIREYARGFYDRTGASFMG